MCDASAGCKWKAILLSVLHHYSFWQLFKSVCVCVCDSSCISVSMICSAYVFIHVSIKCAGLWLRVTTNVFACVPLGVCPHACLLAGMNFTPSCQCSNMIMCDRACVAWNRQKKNNPILKLVHEAYTVRVVSNVPAGGGEIFFAFKLWVVGFLFMLSNFLYQP